MQLSQSLVHNREYRMHSVHMTCRPGQFPTAALLDVAALLLHAVALLCEAVLLEPVAGLNRRMSRPVEEEESRSTCSNECILHFHMWTCEASLQAVEFLVT